MARGPTAEELQRRNIVNVGKETITNVSSTDFPGSHPGEDLVHVWSLEDFKQKSRLTINRVSDENIEFDLVGVDASIANAIRRTVIADVPTVAIETVYVWNNTTIIQDEVMAQRLGLIPLAIDPRKLQMKASPEAGPTDLDTVVFNLCKECKRRDNVTKGETDPTKIWTGTEMYSSELEFDPKGSQAQIFANDVPRAANPNILIAKLRGGQEFISELHCIKGTGKEHAKWSPVATASYRLMPHIDIVEPIPRELLPKFQNCFAPGVIDISTGEAKVIEPRKDTVSREVYRHEEFEGKVKLGRVRDWFIFSFESAGQYPPQELLPETIKVLQRKIRTLQIAIANTLVD